MFSILYPKDIPSGVINTPDDSKEVESFYTDLNIDRIIGKISECWSKDISGLYYSFPENIEVTEYRKNIFSDIKKGSLLSLLDYFVSDMEKFELFSQRKDEVENEDSKDIWHVRAAAKYAQTVMKLRDVLEDFKPGSEGIGNLKKFLEDYCVSEEFVNLSSDAEKLLKELSGFRLHISYSDNRFTVTEGEGKGKYEDLLSECFPGHDKFMKNPYLDSPEPSMLEYEAVRIFKKNHREFFDRVESFVKNYKNFAREEIILLKEQLPYYQAFLKFTDKMKQKGYFFCTPEKSDDEIIADDLYDLALVLAIEEGGKKEKIVPNDVKLAKGESFFVLTGPNQGGKTTFARSLGQLVFFSGMGLDVPALNAKAPYYKKLLTHFEVEESSNTGRGKLTEELTRLRPIMQTKEKEAFVVINELFTTAANYDANIMGKRVLDRLCGLGCHGIYVTHLGELAKANERVVSLRAEVGENEERTFRVFRGDAEDIAYANHQVQKYGLTYNQIRESMGEISK